MKDAARLDASAATKTPICRHGSGKSENVFQKQMIDEQRTIAL
jgi:hypothetical protein